MKKWQSFVLTLMVVSVVCVGCAALFGSSQMGIPERVLTDSQYVIPGATAIPTHIPVQDTTTGQPTGREYMIVSEDGVQPGAPIIPLEKTPQDAVTSPGFLTVIEGALAGTPLGPWAPLAGYLLTQFVASRRSRTALVKGAKAIIPGKSFDPKEVVLSVPKATGWLHTSEPAPAETAQPPAA